MEVRLYVPQRDLLREFWLAQACKSFAEGAAA